MKKTTLGLLVLILLGVTGCARSPIAPVVQSPTSTAQPASKDDLIVLDSPLPESTVRSPLHITGKARGNWFFEASFPVILTDWDGRIIAEGYAMSKGEWMTTDYVPFEATLNFKADTSVSNRGSLILKKDNPSGDPKLDNALEITVFFDKTK